jgi:hypothetical protein
LDFDLLAMGHLQMLSAEDLLLQPPEDGQETQMEASQETQMI